MEKELKDRLHDAQVCSPAQNYCRNRHVMEEAANRIEVLEEKLKATVDDAKEAEDYAEELEVKLEKAMDLLYIYTDPMAMTDEDESTLAELTEDKTMKEYPEKRTVTWIDDETGLQCGECEYIRADIVEELEAKLAKAVEYMSQAHVLMRVCGWQNALEHQVQDDGLLELSVVEVEGKFRTILAELTGGQSGS